MRPFAVLIAIVFGSAAAIGFGLIATSIVFMLLRSEHPQLDRELPALLRSCMWFAGLAVVSGAALFGTLRERAWRGYAQVAMALSLLVVIAVYWPR